MLLACFVSTFLCFVYTLRCFYIFSETNLLTSCHSASCLFSSVFGSRKAENKYSRNWTGQKPKSIFTVGETNPEDEMETRTRAAKPLGAAKGGLAPGKGVAPLVASRPRLFSYKKPR